MTTILQQSPFQKQHDLQFDLVTELLKMDDESITLDPAIRAKLTELKQLSMELQRASFDEGAEVSAQSESDQFWAEVLRQLVEQGIAVVQGWLQPGRAATLFNASDSAIVVRTYDQRDFLRWVPYGTYNIAPGTYQTIYARGETYFQADIRGRVLRVVIGASQAYDGTQIRVR